MQLTTPAPIGDIYSDVNMRVQLATTKSISVPCTDEECAPNKEFDQQVQQLGARLEKSAFDTYPDLAKRVSRFKFVVAEKEEQGSTSNAAGKVVIFRGVQELYLDEQTLAFVIAREMGHVISRHHDENSGTSILLSVLVGVLFPASNILHVLHGSAAVANATSSITTTAATAASSATSFVGSRVLLQSIKPDQSREADFIAVKLLAGLGWSGRDTADILEACTQVDEDGTWAKDFRISVGYATTLEEEIAMASVDPEIEPLDFQMAQNIDQEAGANGLSEINAKAESSELGLNAEPALNMEKGGKPVVVADLLAADPGKAVVNKSEGNAHFEGAEIVAKNEVSVLPDAMAVGALAMPEAEVPEAKLEEQEVSVKDRTSGTLMQEPQSSDAVNHKVTKLNVRRVIAKKFTSPAGLNRNGNKVVSNKAFKVSSKTSSKVVAGDIRLKLAKANISDKHGNTRLKLAKADISGKQGNTKKFYASNSYKVRLAMCARCGQIK